MVCKWFLCDSLSNWVVLLNWECVEETQCTWLCSTRLRVQAVTCPAVCCFTVGVERTRWTGSCPPLGPLAGRALPRWDKQSLLCSAQARAPSTRLADLPGMTSTERSQKRRLSSVWWCFHSSWLFSSVTSFVPDCSFELQSFYYRSVLLYP